MLFFRFKASKHIMNAGQSDNSNNDTNRKLFLRGSSAKRGLFGWLFMPTQHSVPQRLVPSVSGPFSAGERGGGRGWKQGNWDQSVSHCHYQFYPDNTSTFHFHPGNGEGGPSQRQWQEQEMMDMKMSFFFPLPWVDGRKCGVISCQMLTHGWGYSCWSTSNHLSPSDSTVKQGGIWSTAGKSHFGQSYKYVLFSLSAMSKITWKCTTGVKTYSVNIEFNIDFYSQYAKNTMKELNSGVLPTLIFSLIYTTTLYTLYGTMACVMFTAQFKHNYNVMLYLNFFFFLVISQVVLK